MEGWTEGGKEGVPCSTHTYVSDNDCVIIRAKNRTNRHFRYTKIQLDSEAWRTETKKTE